MPLMIEPLVLEPGTRGRLRELRAIAGRIAALVRQAAELGADLIKCDPPSDAGEFHRLVEAAGGRPVLARGGGRMPEEMVFERTLEILAAGRQRHRIRTEYHPAPEAAADDAGADGGGPRRRARRTKRHGDPARLSRSVH